MQEFKENHPYAWAPVPHTVVRDAQVREDLHQKGLSVQPFLDQDQLKALREIFEEKHTLTQAEGGMFYSLYSQDLAYREAVHAEIGAILRPTLESWFQDYDNVINSFVIKVPGPASEFSIHQDTTALDEFRFSPLTAWIPLWDVAEEDGAMCVVPGTQHFLSPYRGISFPFPFSGINDTVRSYLQPVPVKAGEALLFDPRILHNSLANSSDRPRVAIICGIFPTEADFNICFKESPDSEIEIYRQDRDFLLKYPNFMHNCHTRPVSGEVVRRVPDLYPAMNAATFVAQADRLGLQPVNRLTPPSDLACNMIAEPDAVARAPLVQFSEVEVAAAPENPSPKKGFFARLFGK